MNEGDEKEQEFVDTAVNDLDSCLSTLRGLIKEGTEVVEAHDIVLLAKALERVEDVQMHFVNIQNDFITRGHRGLAE